MMFVDVMMMRGNQKKADLTRLHQADRINLKRQRVYDLSLTDINDKETRVKSSSFICSRQGGFFIETTEINDSYSTRKTTGQNIHQVDHIIPKSGFSIKRRGKRRRGNNNNNNTNNNSRVEDGQNRAKKQSAIMQEMVMNTFMSRTKKLIPDTVTNTIKMCHLPQSRRNRHTLIGRQLFMPVIIMTCVLLCSSPLSANGQSGSPKDTMLDLHRNNQDAGFMDEAADFSPIRRQPPTSLSPHHHNHHDHHDHHPQHTTAADSFLLRSGSTEQATSGADHQIQPKAKRADGSSAKFSRVNELDVFLDDMNHNELRAVATGKPIGDYLFQARPLAPDGKPIHEKIRDQHERLSSGKQTSSLSNSSNSSPSSLSTGRSLDESQSEQQIYSECALILQRTYVKNIDNPKHHLVPFGKTEQACIGYKHIDKAVEQAKHMLKFKELTKRRKKQKPKRPALDIIHKTLEPPQDLIAAIGELNMATTQILANQFDLSNDELLNGLPLIDMSKTKFWPLCPALVKQDIKCELGRYRTLTGHCNNLKHPTWGAAMTPFARYLPPVHPDGIWIPRKSIITETVFDIQPEASPRAAMILSDDHHEPREPSQPMPVFDERPAPHDRRASSALQPMMLPEAQRAAQLHHGHNGGVLQHASMDHLSSAASVEFASHVRPEEAELASMMQISGSPLGPPALMQQQHSATVPITTNARGITEQPSINKRWQQQPVTALEQQQPRHYHESHSPQSPYLASSFSLIGDAPPHQANSPHRLLASEAQDHAHHHHHQHHTGHQARSVALDLPSARLVTSIVHRDVDLPNHDLSILFMSWGQLLDHDMTRAAQSPPSIKCCQEDGKPKHKLCLPIQVPHDDPFYSKHNVQCLEFRRSLAGLRPNCVLGPRVHQNAITSPIDANFVYGSSQAQSDSLRLFKGGRLRDRDWFKAERLKPLLPAQDLDPDLECIARPRDLFCFLAGDVRVNEQTHLTVLHTIYMREHNRIADTLAHLNPHWDDERIFQETRHIMAAGVQHVMINEYLPLLIGKKMADLYNLTAVSSSDHHEHGGLHWHGYDPGVTTSVSNSFAAAAFRQGHTFIQSSFERFNKFHEFVSSERLRHLFKRPFLLYQPGVMDELVAGMINQASQSYDPFLSEDISGHLFQPPELAFGHDLAAINLQRGREQGLPGYNLFREWCGLPRAETFDQLEPYLTNHTAFHYSRLYKHVDDIDLWSGGISERKLPGAAIGPTFACIIARQFSNTRRGDRFWYENPGLPSSFSGSQLREIRKITLAKILCANSDDLPTFQRWALRLAHPVLNPRLPCNQLPQMDLRAWQEE